MIVALDGIVAADIEWHYPSTFINRTNQVIAKRLDSILAPVSVRVMCSCLVRLEAQMCRVSRGLSLMELGRVSHRVTTSFLLLERPCLV